MDFDGAIERLSSGNTVARASWPRGEWLIQVIERATQEFVILLRTRDGNTEVWAPSEEDEYATDWQPYAEAQA